MPSSPLSRTVRCYAALCHLAGLTWILLLPLAAGCFNLLPVIFSHESSQLPFLIAIFVLTLIIVYSGIPATFWIWQRQRKIHPFVDEQGREALNFQLSISFLLTVIFILTTLLVIPGCSDVAHHYTSPKAEFVFSWVVGWLMFESTWALLLLAPFSIFAAVQAYRGRSHFHSFIRRFVR